MNKPIPFKSKDDYSDLIIIKIVDGKKFECVDIDAMTEGQFKKYCRDTGTEYFKRFNVII